MCTLYMYQNTFLNVCNIHYHDHVHVHVGVQFITCAVCALSTTALLVIIVEMFE